MLQYSRRCPESGALYPDFRFMRSSCPWDLSLSHGEWRPIERSGGQSDESLLDDVGKHRRIYNDEHAEAPRQSGDPEQGLSCAGEAPRIPAAGGGELFTGGRLFTGGGAAAGAAGHTASKEHSLQRASFQPIRRVALLTKTARWRLLADDVAALDDDSAASGATHGVGGDDAMRAACETHEAAVDAVTRALADVGIEVAVSQDARAVSDARVLVEAAIKQEGAGEGRGDGDDPGRGSHGAPPASSGIDACLALGGDGTVLRAARALPAATLLVGVNTDPERSVGRLCGYALSPSHAAASAAALATALATGRYETVPLPRLRITVSPPAGSEGSEVVHHALNECFVGESEPSRTVDLEVQVGGDGVDERVGDAPWVQWRCSGLLVASQLGATAWIRSAWTVHPEQVRAVLEATAQLGGAEPLASLASTPADLPRLAALTSAANDALMRHEHQEDVQFHVREPTPRLSAEPSPTRAQPSSAEPHPADGSALGLQRARRPHGLARVVRCRPVGWAPILSFDGLDPYPLPPHCTVTLEVEPDRQRWLHAARL